MTNIKFDLKDRKILYELDRNCRQSNSQIAKKVGLSKQVVNYRINKLQKQNIIQKYVAQLNIPKLGFLIYRVMLQLQNVNPEKEQKIIKHIQNNPNVHWFVSCFGKWDLVFSFSSKTIMEFNKNLNNMLKPFELFIKDKKILLITDLYHFTRSYLINKKEKELSYFGGEPEKIKLDYIDFEIIKILSENARENIINIADKLKTTVDIIRYRIKKLVDSKIIQSFRAIINRELLGYQYWNILIKIKNLTDEKEKQLIFYLKEAPNIFFASKYMDDFGLGFEVEVKNIEELNKILMDFRYKFSDVIETYETVLFFKEHKVHYLPKS